MTKITKVSNQITVGSSVTSFVQNLELYLNEVKNQENVDAWTFIDNDMIDAKEGFEYVFSISYQFYIFDFYLDFKNGCTYFKEKMDYLYDDMKYLKESSIFEFSKESILQNLESFIKTYEIQLILDAQDLPLNFSILQRILSRYLVIVDKPVAFYSNFVDLRETVNFIHGDSNLSKLEILNGLLKYLLSEAFKDKFEVLVEDSKVYIEIDYLLYTIQIFIRDDFFIMNFYKIKINKRIN